MQGKKIVVGLGGGIAAYKVLGLIRLLVKAGAEVRCVCTPAALEFVTPLSLSTLSGEPVYSDLFSERNGSATQHVSYADWGDLMVVAPATADVLAKFAHGIADNALTTLYLAFHKPVVVVPAMNSHMYRHPATQENLHKLTACHVHVMQTATGALACGAEGEGRMPEAEEIFVEIDRVFENTDAARRPAGLLKGKKILVTAGPTQEAIDPVRYISNHSTGLMGCCIAEELVRRGAEVYLVHGPMQASPKGRLTDIAVVSAAQMYEQSVRLWPDMDMAVLSAAVADYRLQNPSTEKIKKQDGQMVLSLVKTEDILSTLGHNRQAGQLLVGFALETQNELENAKEKLCRKNADLLVLNSLRDSGAGFASSTNKVTFLDRFGQQETMPLKSKQEVACDLADRMERLYGKL